MVQDASRVLSGSALSDGVVLGLLLTAAAAAAVAIEQQPARGLLSWKELIGRCQGTLGQEKQEGRQEGRGIKTKPSAAVT